MGKKSNKLKSAEEIYASAEKMAEISSLLAQRETYIRDIVTFPSSIISVLTPSLLWRYIFGPEAILFGVTSFFIEQIANNLYEEQSTIVPELVSYQQEAILEYNKFISDSAAVAQPLGIDGADPILEYCKILDQLSTPEGISQARQTQLFKDSTFFQYLVQFAEKNGLSTYKNRFFNTLTKLSTVVLKPINELKPFVTEKIVKRISSDDKSIPHQVSHRTMSIQETSLSKDLLNHKFEQLFGYIQKTAESFHQHLKIGQETNFYENFLNSLKKDSINLGTIYAYKWFLLVSVGFGVTIKRLLSDRLVATLYKKYFIEALPFNFKPNQILLEAQTNSITQDIIAQNKFLKIKSEQYILYSRYVSSLSILMLIMLWMSENFSAEFAIFTFSTLITALSGAIKDSQTFYNKTYLDSNLKSQKRILNSITHGFGQDEWSCSIQKDNLESSFFSLTISAHKSLSAKVIHNLIKQAFYKFDIKIASSNRNTIVINATFGCKYNANVINTHIQKSIERQIQANKLKNQLLEFTTSLGVPSIKMQASDANHLVLCKYIIQDKFLSSDKNKELLQKALPECDIKTNGDLVIIIGYKTGDSNLLNKLSEEIKSLRKIESKQEQEFEQVDASLASNRNPNYVKPQKIAEINNNNTETKPTWTKKINWKTTTYDSTKDDVDLGCVESQYFPKNKLFTFFALKQEAFPTEDCYLKFKEKCDYPTLARKKGDEGIKFVDRFVRDENGNVFKAKAKLKVLGEYGDIRAYAEEEISPTGELLYVFKALDLKAH